MNNDWITAFEALKAVYCDDAYSNMAINEALDRHRDCAGSFVRMFVKGVVRDTVRLDYYIDRLAAKGINGIKKRTLIVLRMGIYAIRELDSVPDHAACNEAVALAKKVSKGTDRFINGMLRSYIRQRDEIELPELDHKALDDTGLTPAQLELCCLRYSVDRSIAEILSNQYGARETVRIMESWSSPPSLTLRCNTARISRDELICLLEKEGIKAWAAADSMTGIIAEGNVTTAGNLFRDGFFSIQSLSSIRSIEAFSPAEGSSVLDMCAAPGGKTAGMAELMNNRGSIVSCELHKHRCELIDATVRRLGIDIVKSRQMDASVFEPSFESSFDYVLCDVPCSGLGVIATKPEIKLRRPEDLKALCDIQRSILNNGLKYLKSGGTLMYSTCTINRDENEHIVDAVLEKLEGYSIIEKKTFMPYNDLIGFYYCLIKKG